MVELDGTNQRPFKCAICQCHKELTVCTRCSDEMRMLMINRMLEETPDQFKTQRMLDLILSEITELKEALSDLKIKNLMITKRRDYYEF